MQCNTAGRDLVSVVHDIQRAVDEKIKPILKDGYFIEYGGQFEARQDANRRLLLLGSFAVAGIFLLLFKCLASWRAAIAGDGQHPAGRHGVDHRAAVGQPPKRRRRWPPRPGGSCPESGSGHRSFRWPIGSASSR